MVLTATRPTAAARVERPWRSARAAGAVVFLLAAVTRLGAVARGGGFGGSYGYDQSVYYDAAAALLHGRVPYRYDSFVLLHPPLIVLALLPFALLGHLTSDHAGYATANVAFALVGALNAALVFVLVRRLGLRTLAALAGGAFYAVWFGTANGETSARLEPLGNLSLLLGCLALARALTTTARWAPAAAGALLAAGANVKIWFVLPLVVLVAWLALVPARRAIAARVAAAAAATAVALDVPFLVASRGEMWHMVIGAQLGRPADGTPLLDRLSQLTAVYWMGHREFGARPVLTVVAAFALLVLPLLAWRTPQARLYALLTAAHVATLALAPSWFPQYGSFVGPPLAVCVAGAVAAGPVRLRAAGLAVLAAAAGTVAILIQGTFPVTRAWGDVGSLRAVARHRHCVMSDSPAGLLALDVLDRDLRHGCRNWVDVTGRTYLGQDHGPLPRTANNRWQHDLVGYLRSGQAVYLALFGRQLAWPTYRAVTRDGVLVRAGSPDRPEVLYRVRPPRRQSATR